MFLDNKYTRWYNSIVYPAQSRCTTEYTEKHHIIPKSLGGSNLTTNLVRLTAREHFICHLLLPKMLEGKARDKMVFAAWKMANQKNVFQIRHIPNSQQYEKLRIEFAKCKRSSKQPQSYYEKMAKFWTPEQRELQSKRLTGNIHHTPESKDKIRQYQTNKTWTEAALKSRLDNCLRNAASRKGKKNPGQSLKIFNSYVRKNIDLFPQIWDLADKGLNTRKISLALNLSYDKIRVALMHRLRIEQLLSNPQGLKALNT